MKKLFLALSYLLLAVSSINCQTTRDTTIVINIITNDTLNICFDDTTFIHYIINSIPGDTVCSPVIVKDTTEAQVWYGYEIDSTYLTVRNADGDLPRRENGTFLYWKADPLGQLFPKRTFGPRVE